MLYTARTSILGKNKTKMKCYYLITNYGNSEVVPDQLDLEQYKEGVTTWQGFKVSYLTKLMKPEAEEWMKNVAVEAASQNVVLVSDEEGNSQLYRVFLAEMIMNMFSNQMGVKYAGELKGFEWSN